jgi:hypothetical protein
MADTRAADAPATLSDRFSLDTVILGLVGDLEQGHLR